jgi:tRNA(fMet)-specific endonuclease VapC
LTTSSSPLRYLLDTSVCVQVLRGHEPSLHRLSTMRPDEIALAAMTVAELRYGASKSRLARVAHDLLDAFLEPAEILPFDRDAAEQHASSRRALDLAGTPIGERDLVIASTALARGLIVATHNVREFVRVPGLDLEAWVS